MSTTTRPVDCFRLDHLPVLTDPISPHHLPQKYKKWQEELERGSQNSSPTSISHKKKKWEGVVPISAGGATSKEGNNSESNMKPEERTDEGPGCDLTSGTQTGPVKHSISPTKERAI